MDEPFGAIDAINRVRLQDELLRIQTKLHKTILFVTHDVEEAFKLGDRIVVMREGRIVQAGAPLELATAPKDDFVRDLIGADDMVRRLGMLPVSAAPLQPLSSIPVSSYPADHRPDQRSTRRARPVVAKRRGRADCGGRRG